MKIKVTLQRSPADIDLVLTADADATVGDVADPLAAGDPVRPAPTDSANTLTVIGTGRTILDAGLALADSGIRSGVRIAISPARTRHPHRAARPAAVITVLDGPDRGQRLPLAAGNHTVGRSVECDLRLSDTLVFRRHLRIFLAPGSAEILDLGSTNGLLLDEEQAARDSWRAGEQLRVGDTVLGMEFTVQARTSPPRCLSRSLDSLICGSFAWHADRQAPFRAGNRLRSGPLPKRLTGCCHSRTPVRIT